MARLTRKDMKVFAGNATNNSVFGSLQAGTPTITNDIEQIQSLAAWSNGWNDATMTSEKLPPLEDLQTVSYVTTYQQAYLMQEGLPEWSATVTYYKGCLAKEVTLTGFKIYNSLTDNNTGNALSDTSNWKLVMDSDDLYALDSTVVHTADLGASSTIVGSDFPAENQNKVLWSATTGKVGTYPYFDANKLQYLNTITSDVQTQLNGKQATITGAASSVVSSNVSGDKALISSASGKIAASSTTSVELGYVHGVTSAIQNQINGKLSATVSKSQNGYIKFSNGIIIQWGQVSAGSGSGDNTVTLPTAFTTTNYSVTAQFIGNPGQIYQNGCHTLTTTSFKIHSYGGNVTGVKKWIAIGY